MINDELMNEMIKSKVLYLDAEKIVDALFLLGILSFGFLICCVLAYVWGWPSLASPFLKNNYGWICLSLFLLRDTNHIERQNLKKKQNQLKRCV